MYPKKILVTGAAGFIGSNLTIALIERGYQVVAYDNLSQGYLDNLSAISKHPNFSFIQGDIMDAQKLKKAAEGASTIFHLAAFKIPRYTDALDTLKINGMGSDVVAQVAIEIGAHLIAASTSDVYGKNPTLPFNEESDLVMGAPSVRRWAYAISKMYEEQLLYAYHERHKMDFTLVRFFGGYGPHQHLSWWGGPQAVFINQALENKPIEVHGDGLQSRTFTFIADHVDGLIRILETPEAKNEVFNLGSFDEITIVDLAKKIWRMIRGTNEAKINFIPYQTFGKYEDVRRRVPDISKAQKILNYTPKTSLDEGLKQTIEWQIKHCHRQKLAFHEVEAIPA